MEASLSSRIEITVPAAAEHLDSLRLVARNACAKAGATVDQLDDAALAVQEAGILLIESGARGEITMSLIHGDETIAARLTAAGPEAFPTDALPLSIIEALTDEFETRIEGDLAEVRLLLRVVP